MSYTSTFLGFGLAAGPISAADLPSAAKRDSPKLALAHNGALESAQPNTQ